MLVEQDHSLTSTGYTSSANQTADETEEKRACKPTLSNDYLSFSLKLLGPGHAPFSIV